ncbi:MAG: RimJ/RimL family protein N-acetyltransferase [Oleispira sp.]|jgi:RimJ/RimL family protein N-acetyltransferase
MRPISEVKVDFPLLKNDISIFEFKEIDISTEYVSWLNNANTMQYSNQRFTSHTYESCLEYQASFENSDNLFLKICDSKSGIMIGTMTLYSNRNHDAVDVGILIGHSLYQGKGYGRMAWEAMIEFLLKIVKVRKITGGALSNNLAMLSIMKNSGMIEDGRRINHEVVKGHYFDMVHFAIFREN